ncbi:MAG: DNA primase, partial [Chthoniobacterales bacterium]
TETIEQIAAANDIVEVIGSYFPLKRAGSTFKALCPFHQEKSPSFTVNPSRQIFKCFGCGAGGSVFRFLELYEHLNFPEAVKKLATRAGIPIIEERSADGSDDRQYETRRTLLQLHAEAAEWFHENLLKREWAKPARDYLKERGIDRDVAANWQIGFAPDSWDALLNWARERGYRRMEIAQSGLVKPRDEDRPDGEVYDRFRGRIMFPICNDTGEVIAFSGRTLGSDSETAKYLNSPETPLFRKGNVLFGLHKTKRAIIEAKSAIVCEGQLDLITLFEAGITNVVAPQGTAFTEQQARTLSRFVEEVVLCFDADAAGQKAAERSLEALLQNNLMVRIAEMPSGDDPDSIVRRDGKEAFEHRILEARDFFDYWIEREANAADLTTMGSKMQLARKMAETVARVHDPIMRSEVASRVATRIGVAARDFEALLKKPARSFSPEVRDAPVVVAAPPRHDVSMLCLLALRDTEARTALLNEDWREVLSQTPDAEMLLRILEGDLRPDDPASVNRFMSQLAPGEEALVSSWLMQKMPANAEAVARGWWAGLKQAVIRRQLQIAEGRLSIPQLSAGEMTRLQKQVVDLKMQLGELSAVSPARVLDH